VCTRHLELLHAAITCAAPYLGTGAERGKWTAELQNSRFGRGAVAWSVLKAMGREGVGELVDRMCGMSGALAAKLSGGGVAVLHQSFNQCLIQVEGGDEVTRSVVEDVVAGGEVFIGATMWEGRAVIRLSVCNWAIQMDDVEAAANAILASVNKISAA